MTTLQHNANTISKPEVDGLFVQYGCGLSAPDGWVNFDASPTLRLQKIPVFGRLATQGKVVFPSAVRYGDIVKGLPIKDNRCDGVYASHVLEHLALKDFYRALKETLRILKPRGTFRLIVPDLRQLATEYLKSIESGDSEASHNFMRNACLGIEARPSGLKEKLATLLGNANHLWMWDSSSMNIALAEAGFRFVREAHFGDSEEPAFSLVENSGRFDGAIAFEAIK